MSVTVTHPTVSDLAYLARAMRPDEIEQYMAGTGAAEYDPDEAARLFVATPGPAFLIVGDDGLPAVAGGFFRVRPGVWEGWQAGTVDGWAKHWRAISRITRRLNDQMLARPDVHRLQLIALAGRDKTFEWYERALGYAHEAVLRRYCADGRDAVMFVRIKPVQED